MCFRVLACLLLDSYSPLRALAYLIMQAHSSLLTGFCRHLVAFLFHRSFSTSSSHFSFGLPLSLLSSGVLLLTIYATHKYDCFIVPVPYASESIVYVTLAHFSNIRENTRDLQKVSALLYFRGKR